MNSPDHRNATLTPNAKFFGWASVVGMHEGFEMIYYTQIFIGGVGECVLED